MHTRYIGTGNHGSGARAMRRTRIASLLLAGLVVGAMALPAQAGQRGLAFAVTGGVSYSPSYFGSDSSEFGPTGRFSFHGLRFGGFDFGERERTAFDGPVEFEPGFGLRGALRYIPERDAIFGIDSVNQSLELGAGLHFTETNWQVYTDLRYGAIGHEGIAGEAGANLFYRGEDGLVLHAGPRVAFGNSRFNQTYFGVPDGADLPAYNAGSGIISAGVEIGAYQALSNDWAVTGALRYDRLRGDAGNSPIVREGQRGQFGAEIGLQRHFNLRF